MIDILIPVLGRPGRAEPLVQNIKRVTKESHHILFLCSLGDEEQIQACIETCEDVCVVSYEAGAADFAKKINTGYRSTDGDFIQIGADDLVFHKGWDVEALRYADTAGVIGTNDLHNPRVKRGYHSTHPLISRTYIEVWNGTFDHSGEIFCEHYDHQYVDDEFVQTAQARRQWAFAKNSHVEHLHPYFDGAEMDATYEKALRNVHGDWRLYKTRLKSMRRRVRVAV